MYGTHTDAGGHVLDNINDIDLFAGGLAEDHAKGASVGPVFSRIIADQFSRTRAGDRLWYQQIFSGSELKAIQQTTLADVISRTTTISNLQQDVFFFSTGAITGTVFRDFEQGRNPAGR